MATGVTKVSQGRRRLRKSTTRSGKVHEEKEVKEEADNLDETYNDIETDKDEDDDSLIEIRQETIKKEKEKALPKRKKQKISQLTSMVNEFSKMETPIKRQKRGKSPVITQQLNSFKQPMTAETQHQQVPSVSDSTSLAESDQWIDKYAPKNLTTLALHKRKLNDVKEALESMISSPSYDIHGNNTQPKLLILSGPSGASKSTSIKLLASELIPESIKTNTTTSNSSSLTSFMNASSTNIGGTNNASVIEWFNPNSHTIPQFQDFLGDAKYKIGKNLSVILIEELPNVFHSGTQDVLQRALWDWVEQDRLMPPLVVCITEYDVSNNGDGYGDNINGGNGSNQSYGMDNSYMTETILGRKLLSHHRVKRIKFNPMNATLIKKTLRSIVSQEGDLFSKISSSSITDKINELATFGDIRAAIAAFQFWSRWQLVDSELGIEMGKETVMSIFHAIGKCIYGTKNEGESENESLGKVNADYSHRGGLLRLGLLENYSKFNNSSESNTEGNLDLYKASELVDGFSSADCMRNEAISLEISTRLTRDTFRGLTYSSKVGKTVNSKKQGTTESGFNFPREYKVNKKLRHCNSSIIRYIDIEFRKKKIQRSFNDANLIHGYYEPLINKEKSFKNKSKLAYLNSKGTLKKDIPKEVYEPIEPFILERLGGEFGEVINVDGDVVADDERDINNNTGGDEGRYFMAYNNSKGMNDESEAESEFEDDPIVDSEDGDDTFGDDLSFENALLDLSQRKDVNMKQKVGQLSKMPSSLSQSRNAEFFNDFDDDFSD